MKVIKFLTICTLIVLLSSCEKDKNKDGNVYETGNPATLSLTLKGTRGGSSFTKAIGPPADESKITNVTIFVFKQDGSMDGLPYRIMGSELQNGNKAVLKKLTEGIRDVYVVVNGDFPEEYNKWNNISEFKKHVQLLETQTGSYLTMIGQAKAVQLKENQENTVSISLYRICARLVAKWSNVGAGANGTPITTTETGISYTDYYKVTDVFVLNAPQKSRLYHEDNNAIITFDSVHGSSIAPPSNSNILNQYKEFLHQTVDHGTDNNGSVYFYTFEKRTKEQRLTGNTKLVLKTTYTPDNKRAESDAYVCYYPAEVNVPLKIGGNNGDVADDNSTWGVRRNTIYNLTYKITKAGVDDPWVSIPPVSLEVIVSIEPWDIVNQDWEY